MEKMTRFVLRDEGEVAAGESTFELRDKLTRGIESLGVPLKSASRHAGVLVANGVTSVEDARNVSIDEASRWYGSGAKLLDALMMMGAVDDRPPAPLTAGEKLAAYDALVGDMADYIGLLDGSDPDRIEAYLERARAIGDGDAARVSELACIDG